MSVRRVTLKGGDVGRGLESALERHEEYWQVRSRSNWMI